MRAGKWLMGCSAVAMLAGVAAARADVAISKKATANMSCSAGVCSPTAKDAVLNATDLATMLASGDVTVTTGSGATDIVVKDGFSWTSTSRLTLDAFQSVEVDKPVTVAGAGAMTIMTNDGGSGGEFIVLPEKANVQFWDLSSSLVIDGQSYTLVGDLKTLAADIAATPSGFYALAKDYDASVDGTYGLSAISTEFDGVFDGLGNKISRLSIKMSGANRYGLFAFIGQPGLVKDIHLVKALFQGVGAGAGGIACLNEGVVEYSSAGAEFDTPVSSGGLVAENHGAILNSHSDVKMRIDGAAIARVGALVAYNAGTIDRSYAHGSVGIKESSEASIGGLVGENTAQIAHSYTLSVVANGRRNCCSTDLGGAVGVNDAGGTITQSYAGGPFKPKSQKGAEWGGFVGFDGASDGSISSTYWDLDMGVSNPHQGAGNRKDDPGISGLTTAQFQSRLPKGFDRTVWDQTENVNGGFPYLHTNPPK